MAADRVMLDARVVVDRGQLTVDVEFTVGGGEVLALLGPNGAGKSTVLRVLAGLLAPRGGRVELAGEPLDDPAVRLRVPTEDRQIGVVFQDGLLFPHLSALDNVGFGPRSRGAGKAESRAVARHWLERVGLAELAAVRPRRLSGGQAQRVALARALATDPRMLLLDEPLSALDARTRLDVRADLRRHLGDFAGCTVLVTHDPVDAMALADQLIVMEQGRIVQAGSPLDVAKHPRTDYVARLVGLVLLTGTADGHIVTLDSGATVVIGEPAAGSVFVAVRPASVAVYRDPPSGSPRNVWPGRVAGVTPYGDLMRVDIEGQVPLVADVTLTAAAELDLVVGADVWAVVKATEMVVYPA